MTLKVVNPEDKETNSAGKTKKSASYVLYMVIVGLVFAGLTVVFLFFPHSTYSELEKRDLKTFPPLENLLKNPSQYTADISAWFSDSEPYRDVFMSLSMGIRDALKLRVGEGDEVVSFRPAAQSPEGTEAVSDTPEAQGNPLADANAKIAHAGIVIVGSGPDVRALMAYGGAEKSGTPYLHILKAYKEAFPDKNIYAMPIPTSTEFYLPTKAAKASRPQKPTIDYIRENLPPGVRFVDAYNYLAGHTKEDIYLRTDHHWAPLGAFYAAKALAKTAGVPFKELDSYERHVTHNYVGSMYGYSKDIAVKNAPEDFVYYTPKNVDTKVTYITFHLNKDYQITSETAPYQSNFFHKFPDGSGGAYCTFMGGDSHLVKIKTGVPGNRRLVIIKDSFGNAVPGYLFYSFNEIHVVDFRYFPRNMKEYVRDNKITDIVVVMNSFNICSPATSEKIRKLITQPSGIRPVAPERKEAPAKSDNKDDQHKDATEKPQAEPQVEETEN